MTYEQQFLDALKAIFIGAKVEGDSGYINLMKIKAGYFEKGVFPVLMKDIDSACKPFAPKFREELFDKLYDFFQHYFSESGSIYFRNTAQHHNIYEKVYTDDRDVMLFWKTHMLYYVKTDRLFNSMEIEVDQPEGWKFFFDVSGMELKRSNEKRELIYAFKSIKNGVISLTVGYSEKGRKTKIDEIVKAINADDGRRTVDDEILTKAFRVFEKQSEVDYFINKNARAFLQEQFDLWMYQYIFKGESDFDETRLKQLQAMKGIAYKIIDFIAQFEDELVRIWNKPKFVLNSNYVITLDHVLARSALSAMKQSPDGKKIASGKNTPRNDIVQKIFKHKGMKDQIAEWIELGMIPEDLSGFTHRALRENPTGLLNLILEKDLVGEPRYPQLQFLPLDTKYFKDLELDILALFDDLDSSLDGWLIHSENYQALNTLLPKFQERVKAIYIDPPYNTGGDDFMYRDQIQHASWLTMMENRLRIVKLLMSDDSAFLASIDDKEIHNLRVLLNEAFGEENFVDNIIWKKRYGGGAKEKHLVSLHEYVLFFSKDINVLENIFVPTGQESIERYYKLKDEKYTVRGAYRTHPLEATKSMGERKNLVFPIPAPDGTEIYPKRQWLWSKERTMQALKNNDLEFIKSRNGWTVHTKQYLKDEQGNQRESKAFSIIDDVYTQHGTNEIIDLFSNAQLFAFPKPSTLINTLVQFGTSNNDESFILDFFAGSGTTAHAVMNLNRADGGKRKYILVEMGEHFNTVILPRVKKVAFSSKWKDGKAVQTSEVLKTSEVSGISHFAKYFELEQYEDALKKARYEDAPLFQGTQDAYTSYVFLRDLKMLEAVKMGKKKNNVEINLDVLYNGIDLAETLSCLTGKWIKRITKDTVEFQDGASASLSAPAWGDVKPLIWW